MNTTDIRRDVAERAGVSVDHAHVVVGALLNSIRLSLQRGESVQLRGFGTFEVQSRKARRGMNPATKEPITIPACRVIRFRAAGGLKEAVNKD